MKHWFFFSYARINKNDHLKRFYSDLWQGLAAELTAAELKHNSFADWEKLELMSRWGRTLQESLEWSRLLVCVTSAAYLTQEWCGKELAFFERLSEHHFGSDSQRVLPVIWGKATLPPALSQYQFTEGSMPDAYLEKGLASVMRSGMWGTYRKCMDAFVEALAKMGRATDARGGVPGASLATENSAFHVPNRLRTRVVYCCSGTPLWQPFFPPPDRDESAHELVETVVARRQIGMEELPVTPSLADSVQQAGDDPVLILVDPRAARDSTLLEPFARLDRTKHKNTALFIAWNEHDPALASKRAELERCVNDFFVPRIAIPNPPARSASELQDGINATLERFESLATNRSAATRPVTGQMIRVSGSN